MRKQHSPQLVSMDAARERARRQALDHARGSRPSGRGMRGGGGDEMPNSMAELHSLLQARDHSPPRARARARARWASRARSFVRARARGVSLAQSLSTTGGGDLQQVEDLMIMEAMRLSMNNEGAEGAPSAGAPAARDGVPAAAPTNPARPSAARSAQSAVALAVAAAAEDAMHAHDSDDDGDGGASPGHGLRGPSPGASPAMSPALQGLSGLAESFSPEQIPVDEDEQVRNRPREAQRSEKEISQTSR